MQWNRIRSKILALRQFDVQSTLKEAGLPSGLFVLPRFALELMMGELSPVAFKVFLKLYSMLDFELRTHWVSGISTIKLAEVCQCRRGTIQKAIKELQEKGYIYVISGKKHQAKARGIRKHVYGQARRLGGNDYNAYSLLPFFVKLYMELDSQRFKEPKSENLDLPPDEEIVKETFRDTQSLKALEDNKKKNTFDYIVKDTQTLKPLGDNEKNNIFDNIDKPLTYSHSFDNIDKPLTYKTTTKETLTKDTHTYDTHTYKAKPAEKNSVPSQSPRPADQLPEPVYEALLDYLRGQGTVKSPIAVLKSLGEKELSGLVREVLGKELQYRYELQEEVDRITAQLPEVSETELLEYVLLSEEGRLKWLEEKGVTLQQEPDSREKIEETIRELIGRFSGNLEKVKEVLKGLYGKSELEKVREVWHELKERGKLHVDKEANLVRWIE